MPACVSSNNTAAAPKADERKFRKRLKMHTKMHTSLENRAICAYNRNYKCLRRMVFRVSHHPHTVEVTGSNPVPPIRQKSHAKGS
jgi:hypothetical protein